MFSQQFIDNFTLIDKRIGELDAQREQYIDLYIPQRQFYRNNLESRILDELAQLPEPMNPTAQEVEECCRRAYKRFLRCFGWEKLP